MTTRPRLSLFCLLCSCLSTVPASAQLAESVGSRALGMGGAFVAVADDSSATWWNPAGLAAGPFLDLALARAVTRTGDSLPAGRDGSRWFAISAPPFGISYYRLRITDIRPFDSTAGPSDSREDEGTGAPVRSLAASQLGATFVQTLFTGLHVGTTVKYVRGTLRTSEEPAGLDTSDLLDRGDDLEGGEGEGRFDLDVGVLAVSGPLRAGVTVRNVRQPAFGSMRLPRQVRVGAAYDAASAGRPPLVVALDVDLRRYDSSTGDRRVVAVGAEQWLAERRLGLRAGARFNTVGAKERTLTGGVSYALRSALYVDAHVAGGGSDDDRGWGVALRVSF